MSIKPTYVKNILLGTKKYEYRKQKIRKPFERIYIYSSSPIKKIVGYFTVKQVLQGYPQEIWDKTESFSGIGFEDYIGYFEGKRYAYAYEISQVIEFSKYIDPKEILNDFYPPQSYCFFDRECLNEKLCNMVQEK